MTDTRQPSAVRAALRNADLRRVMVAYLASCVSEWALWTGLLVYAYATSGTTVAGLVSVGLFVPGALIAPFAGDAADGPRPNRVLTTVYALQAVTLALAAALAYADAHLVLVIVPAAVALTAISYIRPCLSVVVPGLVTSPSELTAANLLTGYCDTISMLAGPLIAGGLIAIDGPRFVMAVCSGLAVLGVVATLPLIRLDPGPDATVARVRAGSRTGALVDGIRSLAERKGALPLLAVLGGQYVLIGGLDLVYVVLANEQFGLGPSGVGTLGAAFGVGAVLGGAASTVLVARKRLAPVLLSSFAAICIALAFLAGVTELGAALVALPLAGLSRAVLDLTGRMLMQRAAPQEALASIFATMESLSLVCCALGSILVQVVIAAGGVRAAVAAIGVVLTVLMVVTAKRLLEVDASADAPIVAIRLLRRIPVFAPLPGPALEGVARAARPVIASSGAEVIREGDSGDTYFALVTGTVEVKMKGVTVRSMTRGEGFGEIALLADVPRTATVVAADDVELLAIDRPAFLTAVTGHDASKQAAWGVARNWDPTLDEFGEGATATTR